MSFLTAGLKFCIDTVLSSAKLLLKTKTGLCEAQSIWCLQSEKELRLNRGPENRWSGISFRGQEILTKFSSRPYGRHAVENLMGVIHRIHGDREIPDTRLWITKQEEDRAQHMLKSLPGKNWLVVVPDNLDKRKVWPKEKYINLINSFSHQLDGVIFEGSGSERETGERIANKINLPSVNLAGKTNLLEAAAVIKRAKVYIGCDSGLGHIAGVVKTPSLILFSVDRPERVLPWRSGAKYLVSNDNMASSIHTRDAIDVFKDLLDSSQDINNSFV